MADKEEIKTLEELEEKGRILREYKEKFRQMCQENKMIKGSTVLKLYDKIEEIQREYEHLDNKLTLMEYNFIYRSAYPLPACQGILCSAGRSPARV